MSKVIKLTENQFGEMMAFHGSGADFDKFNHKKYLKSGAGSQTFGWGTYITDDEEIAKGYTDISLDVQTIDREMLVKELCYKLSITETEAREFVKKFYKLMNGYNIPKHNGVIDKRDFLGNGFRRDDLEKIDVIVNYAESFKNNKIIYEVEIPDDNGFNYLSWYEKPTLEQVNAINEKLAYLEKRYNADFGCMRLKYKHSGEDIYKSLAQIFGVETKKDPFTLGWAKKAASLFLMQCGFDGIKYPAGTKWKKPKGASENAMNYVIFDANKVKIVNKTKV